MGAIIMVTNEEINQTLRNKRKGILANGYLVCDTCQGYYELQPGEKIADFNRNCDCGGTLNYSKYSQYPYDNVPEQESLSILVYIGYLAIIFFTIAAIIIGIILYRRGGREKLHGTLILIISLFLFIPVLAISMLLIYRVYFGI